MAWYREQVPGPLADASANDTRVTEARGTEPSLRAVGRSAAILTGGTVAVQAIGILRELYIAAQVGLSRDLDALLIAMVLPLTLAGVLTSGIVTALVPAYVETRDTAGRFAARRFAGAVLAWISLAGIALSILLVVFANPLISIVGPGLDGPSHDAAVPTCTCWRRWRSSPR